MKVFFLLLIGALLGVAVLPYLLFRQKEMPPGTNLASPDYGFSEAHLLIDRSVWIEDAGRHQLKHEIFDRMLGEIRSAETFLIADFFLWNPWKGALEGDGGLRPLAGELADALIQKREANPDMPMLIVTDPINRIYGDLHPEFFDRLAAADLPVVFTNLNRLPDSNKVYAPQAEFWKKFFADESADSSSKRWLPNPFDPEGEKLTLAQFTELLYFKANHRKVLITGRREGAARMLMPSLNPADGSANHSNIALLVDGPVARFAAKSELAVARWSSEDPAYVHGASAGQVAETIAAIEEQVAGLPEGPLSEGQGPSVAYRSERAIKTELLRQFGAVVSGSRIDIGMFYFSDRDVLESLKEAARRGAQIRLLLDANRDAFGREKNGIPNRLVAAELQELADRYAITVRWAATHGEQFHSKVLRIAGPQTDLLFLGSANWTRRNLDNLNLEANLLLKEAGQLGREMDSYFETVWNNADGFEESLPYEAWAETGWSRTWKNWLYRFQEWSGASTF